jgi:hypothetical protein
MGANKTLSENMYNTTYNTGYSHEILSINELMKRREAAESSEEIVTPSHYDNSKGTIYKVANERGWNPYITDAIKRLERAEKKGEFISDIKKSIVVLELYLEEQGHRFPGQYEKLNK